MITQTQALATNWTEKIEAPISTRWQAVDSLSLMWLSRKITTHTCPEGEHMYAQPKLHSSYTSSLQTLYTIVQWLVQHKVYWYIIKRAREPRQRIFKILFCTSRFHTTSWYHHRCHQSFTSRQSCS